MTSHQVQEVVDIHLVALIGLAELLKVHVLPILLDDLTQGEVLDEEIVEGICLAQLQFLIDVLGQGAQDSLEVFDAHDLVLIIDYEELEMGEECGGVGGRYLDDELNDVNEGGVSRDEDFLEA